MNELNVRQSSYLKINPVIFRSLTNTEKEIFFQKRIFNFLYLFNDTIQANSTTSSGRKTSDTSHLTPGEDATNETRQP